jgi:RNA polymerase sigma factor (sigma-70 family)
MILKPKKARTKRWILSRCRATANNNSKSRNPGKMLKRVFAKTPPSDIILRTAAIESSCISARLNHDSLNWRRAAVALTLLDQIQSLQEQVLENNMGLVHSEVIKYQIKFPWIARFKEDLQQEATIGLIRAISKFTPGRASFSTHATWWIKEALGRSADRLLERDRTSGVYPRIISLNTTENDDDQALEEKLSTELIEDNEARFPHATNLITTLVSQLSLEQQVVLCLSHGYQVPLPTPQANDAPPLLPYQTISPPELAAPPLLQQQIVHTSTPDRQLPSPSRRQLPLLYSHQGGIDQEEG